MMNKLAPAGFYETGKHKTPILENKNIRCMKGL